MLFHNSATSELFREFVVSSCVHFPSANSPFSTFVVHFVISVSIFHSSILFIASSSSSNCVLKRSGDGAQGTPARDLQKQHNNQPLVGGYSMLYHLFSCYRGGAALLDVKNTIYFLEF